VREWEADEGFGVPTRVVNAQSLTDPRDVISIGFVDVGAEELAQWLSTAQPPETVRHERIDTVIESTTLRRVAAMDLPGARLELTITQTVAPRPEMIIAMVEVTAARGGRTLHNHAAHCLFVRDGPVAEWWMVEALPAESEAFWSS
jgi:hypothetical protein